MICGGRKWCLDVWWSRCACWFTFASLACRPTWFPQWFRCACWFTFASLAGRPTAQQSWHGTSDKPVSGLFTMSIIWNMVRAKKWIQVAFVIPRNVVNRYSTPNDQPPLLGFHCVMQCWSWPKIAAEALFWRPTCAHSATLCGLEEWESYQIGGSTGKPTKILGFDGIN